MFFLGSHYKLLMEALRLRAGLGKLLGTVAYVGLGYSCKPYSSRPLYEVGRFVYYTWCRQLLIVLVQVYKCILS